MLSKERLLVVQCMAPPAIQKCKTQLSKPVQREEVACLYPLTPTKYTGRTKESVLHESTYCSEEPKVVPGIRLDKHSLGVTHRRPELFITVLMYSQELLKVSMQETWIHTSQSP